MKIIIYVPSSEGDFLTVKDKIRSVIKPDTIILDSDATYKQAINKKTNRLKPCPFCGEVPKREFDNGIRKFWICCENPKCRIQPSTDAHRNKSVVTREWNRRVDNAEVYER